MKQSILMRGTGNLIVGVYVGECSSFVHKSKSNFIERFLMQVYGVL